jgi:hypothetical protein
MSAWLAIEVRTRTFTRVRSPLAHAAEDRHDQVVRLVVGVDGATDLGYPQPDAEVGEDGDGQAVLVAVEGAMRLADDHVVEAAIRVSESRKEATRVGPTRPRNRTAVPDVEEAGDDLSADRSDEIVGKQILPVV